jgi:hypothetical protein
MIVRLNLGIRGGRRGRFSVRDFFHFANDQYLISQIQCGGLLRAVSLHSGCQKTSDRTRACLVLSSPSHGMAMCLNFSAVMKRGLFGGFGLGVEEVRGLGVAQGPMGG